MNNLEELTVQTQGDGAVVLMNESNTEIAYMSGDDGYANACLFAAAPEMLAALKLMVEEFVPYEGAMRESQMEAAYKKARAAISHAKP